MALRYVRGFASSANNFRIDADDKRQAAELIELDGAPNRDSCRLGPISVEPANAMWFSLMEEKMPTQRQLMAALDAALSAQVNLLFSKMASAASGADPEGRFAAGIKNASSFYDKAADIIRKVVQERQAALAQPRRRRRQARKS
jgi:hypothetical protein